MSATLPFMQYVYSEVADVNDPQWSYSSMLRTYSTSWEQQAYVYLQIAWHTALSPLEVKYRKSIIDKLLRGCSDILSSRSLSCVSNTSSAIQWYCWWSERAIEMYESQAKQLTHSRGGRAPTHRQVCDARVQGKRCFTVEHQYPIAIPKQGLIDGWTFDELVDWMWEYGCGTIVTQEENSQLTQWTLNMEEAEQRYANIVRTPHPQHLSRV